MNIKKNKVIYYPKDIDIWVIMYYDKDNDTYFLPGSEKFNNLPKIIENSEIEFFITDQDYAIRILEKRRRHKTYYSVLIRGKIPFGSWYFSAGQVNTIHGSFTIIRSSKVILGESICMRLL